MRISLAGGGSDLPSYFARGNPGICLTAAINKYVYISVNEKFDGKVRACYSQTEEVDVAEELQHELIRESLISMNIGRGIEIHSCADVPSGTGLGSSSAFTVGLLHALQPRGVNYFNLAWKACDVELNRCSKRIGMQDQYACSLGGVRVLTFHPTGHVSTTEMPHHDILDEFQDHLTLLYTGKRRSASIVLDSQWDQMRLPDKRDLVAQLAGRAVSFAKAISGRDWQVCGEILHETWQIKKEISDDVSSSEIDRWYDIARDCGVWGGKICGAGAGGFLLLLGQPHILQEASLRLNLKELSFQFDYEGTKVIFPNRYDNYQLQSEG